MANLFEEESIFTRKVCTWCRVSKPHSEFGKGKSWRDGLYTHCRDCVSNKAKERYVKDPRRKERYAKIHKRNMKKYKDDAYNAYGGYICVCCGDTDELALQIDHVNNNGERHRAEIRKERKTTSRGIGGYATYRWLKLNNYPPGFQILCASCNFAKHRNGGVLPDHRKRVYPSLCIPLEEYAKRGEV